jgi:hypothetical protein
MNWNFHPLAFFELFVVLAFGVGWLILEWNGKRLDRKRKIWEAEYAARRSENPPSDD